MGYLSTGKGLFRLDSSDLNVGSYFEIGDVRQILELDKISDVEFEQIASERNLLANRRKGIINEKDLKKKTILELRTGYSSATSNIRVDSFDELVLKSLFYKTLPGVKVVPQAEVKYSKNRRGKKKVDFQIDYNGKVVLLEFDGPGHFDGNNENPLNVKSILEDENGVECVLWPYWIQRCAANVKAIFDPNVIGFGALWSTKFQFGSFSISDPAKVIIAESKRFNAIRENGIGYFYGADENEKRCIPTHPIVQEILSGSKSVDILIPPGLKGDKRFWLPQKLWKLL